MEEVREVVYSELRAKGACCCCTPRLALVTSPCPRGAPLASPLRPAGGRGKFRVYRAEAAALAD